VSLPISFLFSHSFSVVVYDLRLQNTLKYGFKMCEETECVWNGFKVERRQKKSTRRGQIEKIEFYSPLERTIRERKERETITSTLFLSSSLF